MKMQRSPNPVLDKALRLLVHPLTLLALVLLLLNDHLFRRLWPSVLTGKLGDFAWLFVIPLVVLALLAVLIPGNGRRRSAVLPLLAYGGVGLIYTLAKTLPPAHAATVSAASQLFGFDVGWRLDPTDLVALTSLAASAVLWRRGPQQQHAGTRLAPAGWVALIAAALLTVANSPAPDPGIYCLDATADEMDAYSAYSTFRSTDGGLSWASLPNQPRGGCPNPWGQTAEATFTTIDPNNPKRQFRITPGQSIELSEDGGATWRSIYTVPKVSEGTAAAERRRLSSYATVRPVPLDAKVDRATGNAVFAMGHSGVLVLEAKSGAWREVAVGTYRPPSVVGLADYLALLLGEILLGVALAFLGFATLATRLLARGRVAWIIALVVAWLAWAADVFLFPPALTSGYGSLLTYGAMLVLAVILLVLTVISVVAVLQHGKGDLRRVLGRRAAAALAAALLFLLPYALWAVGAIPGYFLAAIFGTLLGVAALVAGARWVREPHDLPR